MNYQKLLLSTLGGAVTFFFAGWIIWGFGLMSIQQSHTKNYDGLMNEMPNMGLMAVSMIATALAYSLIYHRWAGIKTFRTGAIAGAVLAALLGLGHGLMMMASMDLIDSTVVLTDLIGNILWGALGGGVMGWILGRGDD